MDYRRKTLILGNSNSKFHSLSRKLKHHLSSLSNEQLDQSMRCCKEMPTFQIFIVMSNVSAELHF